MHISVFIVAMSVLFTVEDVSAHKKTWISKVELKHVPRIYSTIKTISDKITDLERSKGTLAAKKCRRIAENYLKDIKLDGHSSVMDCIKSSRKPGPAENCADEEHRRITRESMEVFDFAVKCMG